MLTIIRRFRLSCSLKNRHYMAKLLNEFDISVLKLSYTKHEILDHVLETAVFECLSIEEKLDNLIEFLQLKYNGYDATISY